MGERGFSLCLKKAKLWGRAGAEFKLKDEGGRRKDESERRREGALASETAGGSPVPLETSRASIPGYDLPPLKGLKTTATPASFLIAPLLSFRTSDFCLLTSAF
jgi:hypothetical protein